MFVVVQADLLYILDLAQLFADDDAIKQVLSDPEFTELEKSDPEIEHRVQIVRLFQAKEFKEVISRTTTALKNGFSATNTISLARALHASGAGEIALTILNSALVEESGLVPIDKISLLYRRSRIYLHFARYSEALQDLTIASSLSESTNTPSISSQIMQDLATIAMNSGDPVKAIMYVERALNYLERTTTSTHKYVNSKINLASLYVFAGRLQDALSEYEQLSSNELVLTSRESSLVTFLNLAITHKRLGNYSESLRTYHRVIELAKKHNEAEYEVRALIGITDHYVIVGDLDMAKKFISLAIEKVNEHELHSIDDIVNIHLANVDHALGDHESAITRLQLYYDRFNDEQNVRDTVLYGVDLADWLSEVGRYQEAFSVLKNCSSLQKRVYDQEIERTTQLSSLRSKLDVERESIRQRDEARTAVLHSVLPAHIAQRLLAGERKIGERVDGVTILFADVVGFTQISTVIEPEQLVELLEELFTKMDGIALKYGCERIKTIGDSYMAACGLADAASDHVERICSTALAFLDQASGLPLLPSQLRIGIHTGPVVAGVMSGSKLSYDIWGDTVNVASRMENHSAPGRILCSSDVAHALNATSHFLFEKREPLDIRGKGLMTTFWLSKAIF